MPGAVGIISPGDMGAAIGAVLTASGLDVATSLDGRSELTKLRAAEAKMRDAGSIPALVEQCGVLLSVLVPSEAVAVAERVADAMAATGARPAFVECNAIAPRTVERIATLIGDAGATVIDAGIIGSPPTLPDPRGETPRHPRETLRHSREGGTLASVTPAPTRSSTTRLYCSGPDTSAFEQLGEYGLDVRRVGPLIGQASGLKMVYAASTKGTTAVWTELLVAAEAMGLKDTLLAEFGDAADPARHVKGATEMPRRARRWVGEMEEIAATFEHLGLTPKILQGAADMYRLVGETSLADQTSREPNPKLDEMLRVLAAQAARRD